MKIRTGNASASRAKQGRKTINEIKTIVGMLFRELTRKLTKEGLALKSK